MHSTKRAKALAIIGGGAKAAAIAAKAAILRDCCGLRIDITIFEKAEIGANWIGKYGYTDGRQLLCTPAERDLGFPYKGLFNPAVDKATFDGYSWASFKFTSEEGTTETYADWINKGRHPPSHREFGAYLRWAIKKTNFPVYIADVVRLVPTKDGRWEVFSLKRQRGTRQHPVCFDGVVVTGPGPQRPSISKPREGLIFDGVSFWQSIDKIKGALDSTKEKVDQIVVIGGGGTAAAILAWLTRRGYGSVPTYLVSGNAALFTRGDSVFENRLFDDDETWRALPNRMKETLFSRLTRGVVWDTVIADLTHADGLKVVDGRATAIKPLSSQQRRKFPELAVEASRQNGTTFQLRADLVIDARGFDDWWFLKLIPKSDRQAMMGQKERRLLRLGMDEFLKFRRGWKLPPLHAPFHSLYLGAGLASLMSMGSMADRVLRYYTRG